MVYKEKIIDLSLYEDCYAMGDIHGEYPTLKFNVAVGKMEHAVIICCGDIGFGFESNIQLARQLIPLERELEKKDIKVVFFRGNHDDPRYFHDTETVFPDMVSGYPNIIVADDYSIVKLKDTSVLLVGGAISIDRTRRHEGVSYWDGEDVIPIDDEKIEFIKKYNEENAPVLVVCTHSCPSFAPPTDKVGLYDWLVFDRALEDDLNKERGTLTDIYEKLKEFCPIKKWTYGHFHNTYYLRREDVDFKGLDMLRPNGGLYKFERLTDYNYGEI